MPIAAKSVVPRPQPAGPRRGLSEMFKSQRVAETLDFLDEVDLHLPPQPKDAEGRPLQPQLPSDITKLSIEQLGKLYGEFVAMASYADSLLGLADIEHAEGDYEHDVTEAVFGLQTEGGNRDERSFALRVNPNVKAKKQTALMRRAKKVMLTKLISGYERASNALSRELSRRGVEFNNAG